ncbi:MAG: hypothetical protein K9N09_01500 [Candidatus Cloacimonetes bacterium]|nr:hypothetical protein [Candidatus Cloacimonadota bacterium]MCF7813274.1 hypothetical protein [Candidatus Cloacimonadota bacterium]MCF7867349.1 hypothetical protein [Candidatus Cloacimonadota bacterium]MCF7882783.1 hypothetical protein [Candidatus Cloacimonadota bacterium]
MHRQIFEDYKNFVIENPEICKKDLFEITRKLQQSNAKYKGKIINFRYQPMFFSSQDLQQFKSICKTMMSIIQKCTEEYLMNPDFRKYFSFSREMEELILSDSGYKTAAPVARFDIFFDEDFKFCELNGDGTSAMNEANTLEKIFLESKIITKLKTKYKIEYHELFISWLDQLLQIYQEFGGKQKPNIAIADFLGLGSVEEFDIFKQVFEENGFTTVICDPREMKYKNGKLYYRQTRIDLVYRRAVNQEMERRLPEVTDFIKAYKDKAVCVVGPFRSQIMHNKIFFSILTDPAKTAFLNEEEHNFIDKHIPKTWRINDAPQQEILSRKDCYLIKPKDLYGGRDVVCGLDCTHKQWIKLLTDSENNDEFLVQEFCNFTKQEIPDLEKDKFVFKPYKTTLGLFCYNGKFSGLYSRISKKNVIAGVINSITLPSFAVE